MLNPFALMIHAKRYTAAVARLFPMTFHLHIDDKCFISLDARHYYHCRYAKPNTSALAHGKSVKLYDSHRRNNIEAQKCHNTLLNVPP